MGDLFVYPSQMMLVGTKIIKLNITSGAIQAKNVTTETAFVEDTPLDCIIESVSYEAYAKFLEYKPPETELGSNGYDDDSLNAVVCVDESAEDEQPSLPPLPAPQPAELECPDQCARFFGLCAGESFPVAIRCCSDSEGTA